MAIQARRGNDADYKPSKMLPAEFGVAVDKGKIYCAISAGVSKQLMTVEDAQESVQDAVDKSAGESEAWAHGDSFTDTVETTDTFTGDSTTTQFTLSVTPVKMKSVSVDGYNTTAYSVEGNVLTLTAAPLNGVEVVAVSETEASIDTSTDNAKYYKDQAEAAAKIVSDNKANIDTVAENADALKTVATDIENVKKLNENIADIQAVSTDLADVKAVSADLDKINTVNDNIADVNTVATNIADVNTAAAHAEDLENLTANLTDLSTVSTNIEDVKTVSTNIADVNTVVANMTDVNTAAAHATDLENVTANLADIQAADDNAATAIAKRDEAEDFAQESEAWARGSKDGKDLTEGDQFENNSKYYAERAAEAQAQAAQYETGAKNYYDQAKAYVGTVVPELYLDPLTGRLYKSPDGKNIDFALLEGHLYYQLATTE